jgi:glycosyltransferase involved in cell wall biosynthesis
MRVALVSGAMPKSFRQIPLSFVFDEAYELSRHGVEICVVRTSDERRDFYACNMHFHGLERKFDLEVIPFSLANAIFPSVFLAKPWSSYRAYRYGLNIARVAKKHEAHIIHAHFAYPEGFAALLAKCETKKKLIVTLHGYDILTEPTIGYGIRLDQTYDKMVRRVLKGADAVIAASTATYAEALNAGVEERSLYLIPNGVDVDRFNPSLDGSIIRKKYGIRDKFTVFAIRHHVPKNGLKYLIRAIPMVKEKIPNVVFVIGGDGPLRPYHELLTKSLSVSDSVIFVGQIAQEELPYYYATCDVSVIPSVVEAFGLVTIESMSCGKPVIGSKVGGIPDVIEDGVNGFLVKPKDPEAIAEKIILLAEHRDVARKMGKECRKRAETKFSIDRRIDKIIELYHKVVMH